MLIKEDIILLEHRFTFTQAQSTSNLVNRIVNNIDKLLNNSNEIVQTSTNDTSSRDEINRLRHLKKDIVEQVMIINREIEDDLNRIIQVEQNRFSIKNQFIDSTSEWQKMVFDTTEQRRLHIIHRANFYSKT